MSGVDELFDWDGVETVAHGGGASHGITDLASKVQAIEGDVGDVFAEFFFRLAHRVFPCIGSNRASAFLRQSWHTQVVQLSSS